MLKKRVRRRNFAWNPRILPYLGDCADRNEIASPITAISSSFGILWLDCSREVYAVATARYLERTPKSRALYERARESLPGGNTRLTTFYSPYPSYVRRAQGCRLYDVDGNVLVDFLNNYTSLILGHAPPPVVEAIKEQLETGIVYGAPCENEFRLAEMVKERFPSIDKLRYANSGTEATMNAIRAARAYTGREKIAKFEGGYHGTHDWAAISVHPPEEKAGAAERPVAIPDAPGLPEGALRTVLVMPYNKPEAVEQIVKEYKDDLAAIIVEPIMGSSGMIPARSDFLKFLREITDLYNIVLIFDEVIAGFRVSRGGGQEYFRVRPDMTTLGKILGGGFAIGAFGGREDIMSLFDPTKGPVIPHAGTFNGHPITLAAGIATLRELTPSMYERLSSLGQRARTGITKALHDKGVGAQVTGLASLFHIHLTPEEIINYRSTLRENKEAKSLLFTELLVRGQYLASRGMGCISSPMSESEVDSLIEAVSEAAENLKPVVGVAQK
jgi:glutamate-1-semialdehyde 2,1-aminomutase